MAGEGWQMGLESINQPSRSSEVERNPKMSILYFWLERGGRQGLSPSTSKANHQKLNIIWKISIFIFLDGEGWWMGFESIDQSGQSSEVECNSKTSILFFWLERGGGWDSSPLTSLAIHFKFIDQPSWSPEVERNPKITILFFLLERGGGWGLSPSTSPADHQKLNVI